MYQPLADLLRPTNLDEVFGQEHILGKGAVLRRLIDSGNIPNMVFISLVALVLEHYLVPDAKRCYICGPVFAAVTFGLLPFAACFVGAGEAIKLAVVGGVVFTATTWLFTTIQDRLSSGPAAKASAFFSAVSLYMAAQCFMGMFL